MAQAEDVLMAGGTGAAAGSMLGPIGAIAGAGLGVASALRKPQQQGYSKGDLEFMASQRGAQIDQFQNALAASRQKYLAQLPQFQNYAMSRFMPQLEANMAGRGLQVSGGAFGSELGRQAGDFQAQQMLAAPEMERQDLTTVDQARSGLFGAQMGVGSQNFQAPGDVTGQRMASIGGMALNYGSGMMANQALMRNLAGPNKPQGAVVNPNSTYYDQYQNSHLGRPMK